ncbi:MAG: PEP-CTERM sorting domain-containing protein [Planctomycetales bacterium]|nr:PEP-CTERM sorting domain-containing protein [Planctomycetales bacterium]
MTTSAFKNTHSRYFALFFATFSLALTCSQATAAYWQYAIVDTLDGYWDFDTIGNELLDKSGNGNNLTNGGGVTFGSHTASANGWTPDQLGGGQAANFTGAGSNYLAMPNGTYTGGDFTFITAHLRPAAGSGFNTLFASSRFRYQTVGDPTPSLSGGINAPGGSFGGTPAVEDEWHLTALTYDSSTGALSSYIVTNSGVFPGSPQATGSANGGPTYISDSTNFRIGGDGTSAIGGFDGWEGQLDFVAFDNSILSGVQLQQLMSDFNLGITTPEPTTGLMVLMGVMGLAMRRRRVVGSLSLVCVASLAFTSSASAGYWTYNFADQADAFWDFEGGSPLVSKSPGAVTLTNGGAVTFSSTIASGNGWTPDALGGTSANFDRNDGNSYLNIPNGTYTGGDFTLIMAGRRPDAQGNWTTLFSNSRFQLVQVQNEPDPYLWGRAVGDGNLGGSAGSTQMTEDDWHFFAWTYDSTGNSLNVYEVTNSGTLGAAIITESPAVSLTDATNLRIGRDGVSSPPLGGADGWDGQLDFIVFDNTLLNAVQLQGALDDFLFGVQTPEPTTGLMVLFGIAGLATRRRRGQKVANGTMRVSNGKLATVALVCAVSLVVASSASAGIVGYWSFDNDDATDTSGNGNNGVVDSAVTFSSTTPNGNGRAAVFAGGGGNGQITVANSASLQVDDTVTVSYWIKADSAANPAWVRIFRKGNESAAENGWLVTRNSSTSNTLIRYDTAGGGGTHNQNKHSGVGSELDDAWHHIVFVADNGQTREYVDGVLASSETYTHGTGLSNTQPLEWNNQGAFIGSMDDVGLWNSALTPGQAIALFDPVFGYDQTAMSGLFDIFNTSTAGIVGGALWSPISGLSIGEGQHATINNGKTIVLQLDALGNGIAYAIPEPTTGLLVLGGIVGLALRRRRGRHTVASRSAVALLAVVSLACASTASAGMVGYWPFDNSNSNDFSGNANNGSDIGTVDYSNTGYNGAGRSADFGSGDRIDVTTSASLESTANQLSLSFWMKAAAGDNGGWVRIIRKSNEANPNNGWMVTRNSTNDDTLIRYDTNNPSGGSWNQNRHTGVGLGVFDDQWHMVTYVADNGATREYIDGVLTQSTTYTHGNGLSSTQPLQFNTGTYIGELDDIGVYNSSLTAGMITTIFNETFGITQGDFGNVLDAFENPGTIEVAANKPWRYVTGLSLGEGNSLATDKLLYIQLDASGNGVVGFVPEPSTAVLVFLSLVGLATRRRRK